MKTNQELEYELAAINAMTDPYAHLKAAWAAGRRIRFQNRDGTWRPWRSINAGASFTWTFPPDCYEIEPDTTPAGPWAKEKERAEFEVWAATSSFGHDLTRTPCEKYYNSVLTCEAWELWQAARASREVKP